jgi:riboflavin synthase
MFTGIISEIGIVRNSKDVTTGRTLEISISSHKLKVGDSVAVNGVCLTVVTRRDKIHTFNVVPETLRVTNLQQLKRGDKVNLELPLRYGSKLNGHFVLGHVDVVGKVVALRGAGKETIVRLNFPKKYKQYLVRKGSVALNGVSLTIASVGDTWFTVALIPYTLKHTNLGQLSRGHNVNIEFDIFARYIYASNSTSKR